MLEFMGPLNHARSNKLIFNLSLCMTAFFVMKLGQFMIIPFFAIYLSHFSLSPLSIGIIIASGQLSHSITSLFTGNLSDKYNPQHLLMIMLFATGIAYECFYENQSLLGYLLLNSVIGVFRAIFDNASKTQLVIGINECYRNFAFGLRYAVLNAAAALGPLIGAYYAAENSIQLFRLVAYSYFFISFLMVLLKPQKSHGKIKAYNSKRKFITEAMRVIKAIPSLKILFLISCIGYCLYAQIASSLAQHILNQFDQGIVVYRNALLLNAITCVLLQMYYSSLIKKVDHMLLASIALLLLAIGFLGFCFAQNSLTLNLFMFILSLGEIIFFPLNDMLVAKIAPPHRIGSCYGVLNASTIGLAVGPVLGGAIYQIGGHYLLFLICSLGSLLTIVLYRKLMISSV